MKQPMKICILTTAFPRWKDDSRGPFIYQAAKALLRQGLSVRVIAMHNPGAKQYEWMDGIEVIRPKYLPEKLEILQKNSAGLPQAWKGNPLARLAIIPFLVVHTLATVRWARDCDIIHANWTLSGAVAWISQWIHRKPFVITVHGSDIYQATQYSLFKKISRIVLHKAKFITSPSQDLATCVQELGISASKIEVVSNGVDINMFQTNNEKREQILLYAGSLIHRKGVDILIEALPSIINIYPSVKLVIVGEGDLYDALIDLARKRGMAERIIFTGHIPQDDVKKWMQKAKLFVLPSREEGQGVVLLEALACGTPCVGSRVGGIQEVITPEVGRLFKSENSSELAQSIVDLLNHEELWNAMSRAARDKVEKIYDWNSIACKHIRIYVRILEK